MSTRAGLTLEVTALTCAELEAPWAPLDPLEPLSSPPPWPPKKLPPEGSALEELELEELGQTSRLSPAPVKPATSASATPMATALRV